MTMALPLHQQFDLMARAERSGRVALLLAALAAAETPLQVARALMQHGLSILQAAAGGLLSVRDDGSTLETTMAIGYPRDVLDIWQWLPSAIPTPAAEAMRTGEPVWIGSTTLMRIRYPHLVDPLARVSAQALAALPLLVDSRPIAVLVLTFEEERVFATQERDFAESLIGYVAPALRRTRRLEAQSPVAATAAELTRRRNEQVVHASHDLKMPITAIKMTTQLLSRRLEARRTPNVPMILAELAQIDAAVSRMSLLVDELVALAGGRPETMLTRSAVDLVALIERVAAEAQSGRTTPRIELQAEYAAIIGQWDATQLERVFANLFDNALKYSREQSLVRVTLTVEGEPNNRWAVAQIEDEGVGIPAADLPHVFEAFQRATNVTAVAPGTGIGLASARDIVEQHGGSIHVVSRESRGSMFTVRLPVVDAER